MNKIRQRRTDLRIVLALGREHDEDIHPVIAGTINSPFISLRGSLHAP
jgi:hypothetical protein